MPAQYENFGSTTKVGRRNALIDCRANIRRRRAGDCHFRIVRRSVAVAACASQAKTRANSKPWCNPYVANPERSSFRSCRFCNASDRPAAYWNIWLPRPPIICGMITEPPFPYPLGRAARVPRSDRAERRQPPQMHSLSPQGMQWLPRE